MGAAETTGGREPRVSDAALNKYLTHWKNVGDCDRASTGLKCARDLRDARTALAAKDARIAELERQVADAERVTLLRAADRAEKIAKMWGAAVGSSAMETAAVLRDEGAAMPAAAKDEVRHG